MRQMHARIRKAVVWAASACALLAAAQAMAQEFPNRPVKLVLTRSEEMLAAIPAPQTSITLKTGARRDGTVAALQGRVILDSGAFPGAPLSREDALAECRRCSGAQFWPVVVEALERAIAEGHLPAPER